MGARVNGRLVPLESRMDNGDVVEIFTSKADGAGPSRDWLTFVRSPRARNKIRQWFSKERREEAIENGKDGLAKAMRKQHLPIQRLMSHESLVALATEMRYPDVSALYAAIGEGHISAAAIESNGWSTPCGGSGHRGGPGGGPPPRPVRVPRTGDPGVPVKGHDDIRVKLARAVPRYPATRS
jgi:GTP pyrophosphokinase